MERLHSISQIKKLRREAVEDFRKEKEKIVGEGENEVPYEFPTCKT